MKIDYLLRYQNTDTGSDKIWGIICLNPDKTFDPFESDRTFDYVTFWGKKGGRLQTKQWTDEDGAVHTYYTAWGREQGSCGWFWISPTERARLESLGVKFALRG